MKIVYRVILINICTLVGCGLVAVSLPPETPAVPFLIVCLVTLVLMNGAMISWPSYRARREINNPSSKSTTVKLIIIGVIFVLGLIANWMRWHHR